MSKDKEKELGKLMDFVRGRLSPEESSRLKQRIANDPAMQALVTFLSEIHNKSDENDWRNMQKPSHNLFDRMLRELKARRKAAGKRGVTIYDSRLLPPPEGVRPAEVDTGRIKYIIGDMHLEISIYPVSPDSFEIIGLISGQDSSRKLRIEMKSGKIQFRINSNQFGLFRFPRVPRGAYGIKIREGQSVIGEVTLDL